MIPLPVDIQEKIETLILLKLHTTSAASPSALTIWATGALPSHPNWRDYKKAIVVCLKALRKRGLIMGASTHWSLAAPRLSS